MCMPEVIGHIFHFNSLQSQPFIHRVSENWKNVAHRTEFEPTVLAILWVVCQPLSYLGSLVQSQFPHLPIYVGPCLRGQDLPERHTVTILYNAWFHLYSYQFFVCAQHNYFLITFLKKPTTLFGILSPGNNQHHIRMGTNLLQCALSAAVQCCLTGIPDHQHQDLTPNSVTLS